MPTPTTESAPQKMRLIYDEIVKLTDAFCAAHLNDEYAQVCRAMTARLARKRPSPLESGRANTWAAAIAHTVGRINFLFDKSQTPHMRADDLARQFGLSQSTVGNKSKQIMDILNIGLRSDGPGMNPAQSDGAQPDGLADPGQRPDHRCPVSAARGSGNRVPQRVDPLSAGLGRRAELGTVLQRALDHQKLADVLHRHQPDEFTVAHHRQRMTTALLQPG